MTLNPAPASQTPFSPQLGPWFNPGAVLATPAASDGAVVVNNAVSFWPPTAGYLSLFVGATGDLTELYGYDGEQWKPTTAGAVLAVFQIADEVIVRLAALMPTRPTIATFVLELGVLTEQQVVGPASILQLPASSVTEAGLAVVGGVLQSGLAPMDDFYAPAMPTPGMPVPGPMLTMPGPSTLWTFDTRGHPVDPGAVSSWWMALCNQWSNLAVLGGPAVTSSAHLAIQLVSPHEGPIDTVTSARVTVDGGPLSAFPRRRANDILDYLPLTASSTIGVSPLGAGPNVVDQVPMPLFAQLPQGPYTSNAVTVRWSAPRDFVRVAVFDAEKYLVGSDRSLVPTGQDLVETRVNVARTPSPVVTVDTETTAANLIADATSPGSLGLVAPALDLNWGPASLVPRPPVSPTSTPPTLSLESLIGGGMTADGRVAGQSVVATITGVAPGEWVRVMPISFDLRTGLRTVMTGGAGLGDANGVAKALVLLPDGEIKADLRFDLQVTATTSRFFDDLLATRPAPVGGQPTALPGQVYVCEAAQTQALPLPPNTTCFVPGSPPQMVTANALGLGQVTAPSGDTIRAAAPVIIVTSGPFVTTPSGSSPAALGGGRATIRVLRRRVLELPIEPGPLNAYVESGHPLASQSRLEVLTAASAGNSVTATIGSVAPLAANHETGDHRNGHPFVTAGVEVHGTGARLTGPLASEVAEVIRDRAQPNVAALVADLINRPASNPAGGGNCLAAVLRTTAALVDAEPAFTEGLDLERGNGQATLQAIRTEVAKLPVPVPIPADVIRAVYRRFRTGRYGLQEGWDSLRPALAQARDLIYIETPAMDSGLTGALVPILSRRPRLRVVVCLAGRGAAGIPTQLETTRWTLSTRALGALDAAAPGRVAAFMPSAGRDRALSIASTTVIIDDLYAITGTTHLWRRGRTFDSSVAVALFDTTLNAGRGSELVQLRETLLSARLGIPRNDLPTTAAGLVGALGELVTSDTNRIARPIPPVVPASDEFGYLNPIGTLGNGSPRQDPAELIVTLIQAEAAGLVIP